VWKRGPACSARSGTSNGVAIASLTSDVAGAAQVTATTKGTGGTVQGTVMVAFSEGCVTGVDIEGPAGSLTDPVFTDVLYAYDAVLTPANALSSVTYIWSPIPASGQKTARAVYLWPAPGIYTITLSVENCGVPYDAAHVVSVTRPERQYVRLPLVLRSHSSD